jgi:hypothetical protein
MEAQVTEYFNIDLQGWKGFTIILLDTVPASARTDSEFYMVNSLTPGMF